MSEPTTEARHGSVAWRTGQVMTVGPSWSPFAVTCTVALEVALTPGAEVQQVPALAYPELVGVPVVGEQVMVNTAALDARLGTGGYALVIARPEEPQHRTQAPGHIVKARYTPHQLTVLAAEEPDSPTHELLRDADGLGGMPVVVAELHSAVPAVVAGIRAVAPNLAVCYLMTDGAALPAWYSQTIAGLRGAGWISHCITAGQAFGGDVETVTVHSGLLAARYALGAAICVVAQGPGTVGTSTRWGTTGLQAGEALNAVATLRGRGIGVLRISGSDPRPRHQGISHHSLTAYGRVALAPSTLVLPELPGELGARTRAQAATLTAPQGIHTVVSYPTKEASDREPLLRALDTSPVPLSSMGRALVDDTAPFLAAAAAGAYAADMILNLA